VEIKLEGTASFLWKKGEDLDFTLLPAAPKREGDSTVGTIDSIIEDTGLSLGVETIEAYMRDALFNREDLSFTIRRMMHRTRAWFGSREQEDAFYAFLHDYWVRLKEEYMNPDQDALGPLRERIAGLHHAHLLWLRDLDQEGVMPEELPEEDFFELGEIMSHIDVLLTALNGSEQMEDDEIEEVMDNLDDIEKVTSDYMIRINDAIGMDPHPSRSMRYYILHISIEKIHPPIWRKLRVPGNCTLRMLHYLMQVTFGWESYHLHSFYVGTREYTDLELIDDFIDQEPLEDRETFLDDLELTENNTFLYVYDYGDNWRHIVHVESVLSNMEVPEAERACCVCLDGERAGPPEDCGGPGGYEDLINVLTMPEECMDDDDIDTKTWAGDYDPEAFEVVTINRRIRRYLY
jgi:hypothetical protein